MQHLPLERRRTSLLPSQTANPVQLHQCLDNYLDGEGCAPTPAALAIAYKLTLYLVHRVMINIPNNVPDVLVFLAGGAAVARRGLNVTEPAKRDNTKCSGFTVKSQQISESMSVQASSIVDCTNGNDSGCMLTTGFEHAESVTTSYSLTAGGGIEGICEASATFGMDYTDPSTTPL